MINVDASLDFTISTTVVANKKVENLKERIELTEEIIEAEGDGKKCHFFGCQLTIF